MNFIEYVEGLKKVASQNEILNQAYQYFATREMFNSDEAFIKDTILELNLPIDSGLHEFLSYLHFLFEQFNSLCFISDHVIQIITFNLDTPYYFEQSNNVNHLFKRLSFEKNFRLAKPEVMTKLKLGTKKLELSRRKLEGKFKKDYFTGKKIILIAQQMALYVKVLSNNQERMASKFISSYSKELNKFQLDLYVEILLDLIEAFLIPQEAFSNDIIKILEERRENHSRFDFHSSMANIKKLLKERKERDKISESDEITEIWLKKIKKIAPQPERYSSFSKILKNYNE
ncbi:hypothetical protein ABET09_14865 [Priestia megaterium]